MNGTGTVEMAAMYDTLHQQVVDVDHQGLPYASLRCITSSRCQTRIRQTYTLAKCQNQHAVVSAPLFMVGQGTPAAF